MSNITQEMLDQWNRYVGDQTPQEFLEISKKKGCKDLEVTVREYLHTIWSKEGYQGASTVEEKDFAVVSLLRILEEAGGLPEEEENVIPNEKELARIFQLEDMDARVLRKAMSHELDCEDLHGYLSCTRDSKTCLQMIRFNDLLQYIDILIGTQGVEGIEISGRSAAYCNSGDSYSATVLYDEQTSEYMVTSWADWRESQEKELFEEEGIDFCSYCGAEYNHEEEKPCHGQKEGSWDWVEVKDRRLNVEEEEEEEEENSDE